MYEYLPFTGIRELRMACPSEIVAIIQLDDCVGLFSPGTISSIVVWHYFWRWTN